MSFAGVAHFSRSKWGIPKAQIPLFYLPACLVSSRDLFKTRESSIGGLPTYSQLLRLNRMVITCTGQACSTRDEIEAPASLEFIALYVIELMNINNLFRVFYLQRSAFYRKSTSARPST
ncbi:MAG: hypothetical protein Q8P24_11320, partial [Desulfobacterales bacterium]|nr:hypothetical protein [Desulfobacterales bacterium]